MRISYQGSLPEGYCKHGSKTYEFKRGVAIDLPDELAEQLLLQSEPTDNPEVRKPIWSIEV